MENKNFEKRETGNPKFQHDTFNTGYNTCLDRTNAKGIYEAGKKVVDWNKSPSGEINATHELLELRELILRLQTELKKAE